MLRKLFPVLAFCLVAVLFAACELSTGDTVSPTEPEPPSVCSRPVPSATVIPDPLNYRATYADTTSGAAWRSWSFEGGQPPTSAAQTGSVSYAKVPGRSYAWTLRVCKAEPTGGSGDCCETTGGLVEF